MPGQFTGMSIRPNCAATAAIILRQSSSLPISTGKNAASDPSFSISAIAFFALASFCAAIAILAPASAKPFAMPSPMPPLPPVTMATLPLRSKTFIQPSLSASLDDVVFAEQARDMLGDRQAGCQSRRLDAEEIDEAGHAMLCRTFDAEIEIGRSGRAELRPNTGVIRRQSIVGQVRPVAADVRIKGIAAPGIDRII